MTSINPIAQPIMTVMKKANAATTYKVAMTTKNERKLLRVMANIPKNARTKSISNVCKVDVMR